MTRLKSLQPCITLITFAEWRTVHDEHTRMDRPTCGAASPTPSARYMVSHMLAINASRGPPCPRPPLAASFRKTGSPYATTGRIIAANLRHSAHLARSPATFAEHDGFSRNVPSTGSRTPSKTSKTARWSSWSMTKTAKTRATSSPPPDSPRPR